jgi:hypothetical protein
MWDTELIKTIGIMKVVSKINEKETQSNINEKETPNSALL